LTPGLTNSDLRSDNMAKSHDTIKKRKKELARKEKKEEKRQRKLDKKIMKAEENPNLSNQS